MQKDTKFGKVDVNPKSNNRNVISALVERCKKINIELTIAGNHPWIYLDSVNGNKVMELFHANHGFTIAFSPLYPNENMELTDIKEIFKIIRKYK